MVDATNLGGIAIGDKEGGNILHDLGAPTNDGMGPDAAELMDAAESADDGIVPDDDMPRKGAVI